ncbi:nicotianamine synthase family protein [Psychrobacillus sp. INOP01]|uniref:nicotianamine synthase family protein n=1 Tax=Psychrobacillus sp. INOP01 TaxID=2829187 RepID=UPI001F1E92CB|nr:nicotianamine synthase family protein [Psychrobacillus sp. INOP01]
MKGLSMVSYVELLDLLDSFENEIKQLMTTANNAPKGLELLGAKLDSLCEFIICDENEKHWKQWEDREDVKQSAERLRETSSVALCMVEKMRALYVYTEELDMDLYLSLLSASVNEERSYAQIDGTAKVLFIGAGAFPLTAFTIAKETSAEVVCTDIDSEAVHYGKELAQFLGLHGILHYSDSHLRHPEFLKTATHIYIASLVPEKQEIIEELKSKVHPDCKIIVRYGNGLKSLFNYPFEISLIKEWQVKLINRDKCIYNTIILQHCRTVAGSV